MANTDDTKKTCFIAMPISTPPHLVEVYGGDAQHFQHILECLHKPAVIAAGLEPISPIAKGSEFIHAGIVKHLQTADLVLMDMSALNANAFYEWGIRTSLNLPVCVLKDDKTDKVPFDAAPINYETYDSRLDAWIVKTEIAKIAAHIRETLRASDGKNALWRHFGFQSVAALTEPKNEMDKLDLVLNEVVSMNHRLNEFVRRSEPKNGVQLIAEILRRNLSTKGIAPDAYSISFAAGVFTVHLNHQAIWQKESALVAAAMTTKETGVDVRVRVEPVVVEDDEGDV